MLRQGRWREVGWGKREAPRGGVRVAIRIWTWHMGGTIKLRLKRGRCVFSRGLESKQENDVKNGGKGVRGSGRESSRGAEVGEKQTCGGNSGAQRERAPPLPSLLQPRRRWVRCPQRDWTPVCGVFPGGLRSLRTRMGPSTQRLRRSWPRRQP